MKNVFRCLLLHHVGWKFYPSIGTHRKSENRFQWIYRLILQGTLAEQSLCAVFGTKSATTILKRCCKPHTYHGFTRHVWLPEVYLCPLPLTEDDVWRYFLHLRSLTKTNKRGYTVSSTFLETVRFSKFVLGLHHSDDILSSKRLLGFAAVEKRDKGPLNSGPTT